jgi:hypothetical protein
VELGSALAALGWPEPDHDRAWIELCCSPITRTSGVPAALLRPLLSWHRFLLEERDPRGIGEPVLIHPWESGRDNAWIGTPRSGG